MSLVLSFCGGKDGSGDRDLGALGADGGGVARLGCSRGCRAIANTIAAAPTMNRANIPFLNVLNSMRF